MRGSQLSTDKESGKKLGFSSNDRMMPPSFDPMKFGLENDLKIALTELRWIRKTRGKLKNSDFNTVSVKYEFPVDFLKRGLKGFSYPEDFLISKSKWFPILYSWLVRDQWYSINLFRLQFDYYRTKFRSILFLGILPALFFYADSTLQMLFKLYLLQRISLVLLPFIFFYISLCIGLRNYIGSKKMKVDEYSTHLEEMGLRYIIANNEKFIQDHYRYVVHASDVLLKKIKSSPLVTLFYLRTAEMEKQPTRFKKLLMKLHLLPKASVSIEKEEIPVFYAENAYIEYMRRIKELADETHNAKTG